jgi:hypothetical protein
VTSGFQRMSSRKAPDRGSGKGIEMVVAGVRGRKAYVGGVLAIPQLNEFLMTKVPLPFVQLPCDLEG